jgi:hypothetical protein
MRNEAIRVGCRVAIKSYNRFPRHWRYTQRVYSGKIATIEKVEHDPINNLHGYRLDVDSHTHRWYAKDFSAVNVASDFVAKPVQTFEIDEMPSMCPKCGSREMDFSKADLELAGTHEIHKIGFCDGCGANIVLKYKFYSAVAIPI